MTQKTNTDLLRGLEAIGEYLGVSRHQIKHMIQTTDLPTFKIGHHVCALRSRLDAWLALKADEGANADGSMTPHGVPDDVAKALDDIAARTIGAAHPSDHQQHRFGNITSFMKASRSSSVPSNRLRFSPGGGHVSSTRSYSCERVRVQRSRPESSPDGNPRRF